MVETETKRLIAVVGTKMAAGIKLKEKKKLDLILEKNIPEPASDVKTMYCIETTKKSASISNLCLATVVFSFYF